MKFDLTKILEYFNKLSDQVRYGLFGGVVFLIILLDVVFLVMPQISGIADVNDQIKKFSEDTRQVLVDKQRINQLKANLQKARNQLNALSLKVRPLQEVPAILSTISNSARKYGVKIDQLTPEKDHQEALTSDADGKYYALPIVVKARCGYHMIGRFLNKLENEDLYFIMQDFIIQNDADDPNTHLFSLTIKVILVDRSQAQSKSL